ncbi:MAG TPA: PEP-CTERM sorting domain-containing protein [Bryobacteraceae bacterium]|nr:PEP-CTERM sorting domain-containing protein [Bryobacteraceae bacterium]
MHKLMLLRPTTLLSVAAVLLAMSVAAHADTINIFSTGSGVSFPGADPNYIFTYVASNPGINPGVLATGTAASVLDPTIWPLAGINEQWSATPAGSKWIGPTEAFFDGYLTATPNVYYVYQQTFNIQSGIDLSTVLLTGAITSDNCPTTVAVNGNGPTAGSGALMPTTCTTLGNSYSVIHTFELGGINANFGSTAGLDYYANVTFHPGLNTIQFIVYNDTTLTPNPTGLAVSLSGTGTPYTIPEPSSAGLVIAGTALVAWLRRRGLRHSA